MNTSKQIQDRITALEGKLAATEVELHETQDQLAQLLADGGDTNKLQARAAGLSAVLAAVPDALAKLQDALTRAEAAEELAALKPQIEAARKVSAAAKKAVADFIARAGEAMEAAYTAAAALGVTGGGDRAAAFFRVFARLGPVGLGQNPREAFSKAVTELQSETAALAEVTLGRLEAEAVELAQAAAEGK